MPYKKCDVHYLCVFCSFLHRRYKTAETRLWYFFGISVLVVVHVFFSLLIMLKQEILAQVRNGFKPNLLPSFGGFFRKING